MPEPITLWKCTFCQKQYVTEELALKCENRHIQLDRSTLFGAFYPKSNNYPQIVYFFGKLNRKGVWEVIEYNLQNNRYEWDTTEEKFMGKGVMPDINTIRRIESHPGDLKPKMQKVKTSDQDVRKLVT